MNSANPIYVRDFVERVKFGNKVQLATYNGRTENYEPFHTFYFNNHREDFWDKYCEFCDDYGDYKIDAIDMKHVDGMDIIVLVLEDYKI